MKTPTDKNLSTQPASTMIYAFTVSAGVMRKVMVIKISSTTLIS